MTSVTVSIWHNVARDQARRHTARWTGSPPATRWCASSPTSHAARRSPEAIAEDAFALANGHPRDDETARLSRLYYQRRLRSLSVGDVVCVGEVALAVSRPASCEAGQRPWPRSAPASTAPARSRSRSAPRAAGRRLTQEGDHGE